MLIPTVVVLIVMGIGIAAALSAFWWAAKNKQFENVEEGARAIFDESEPIGEATDSFPGAPKGKVK